MTRFTGRWAKTVNLPQKAGTTEVASPYSGRVVADSENGDRRGCPAQPLRTSDALARQKCDRAT